MDELECKDDVRAGCEIHSWCSPLFHSSQTCTKAGKIGRNSKFVHTKWGRVRQIWETHVAAWLIPKHRCLTPRTFSHNTLIAQHRMIYRQRVLRDHLAFSDVTAVEFTRVSSKKQRKTRTKEIFAFVNCRLSQGSVSGLPLSDDEMTLKYSEIINP